MSGREAKIQKTGNSQDASVGKQVEAKEDGKEASGSSNILESDVDDLIGDLIKEELQLVVTRLLHKMPNITDELKAEIVRIMKSRSKTAQLPLSRQLKQLQDLLNAQASRESGVNLVSLLGLSGAAASSMDPTQATQLFGAGLSQLPHAMGGPSGAHPMGMAMGGFGELGGFMPGMDANAVRRKIRDAFLKTGTTRKRSQFGVDETKDTYRIDSNIVRMELERANDMILQKNEIRGGLQVMEALTSEFTSRISEIGDGYVSGFEDLLKKLNKVWVDIFLYRDLNLDQEERDEWVTKLRTWDKSASEEEGIFASARYAARHGWDNTLLRNVLKGEGIGKFKEPKELITERLNQLDREKKYEEGVHLAQACDMHFHNAKFLLTLDRKDEAEKAAESLEDAEKLFSIAQIARPMEAKLAFKLALRSVSITNEWNAENQERASYLCEMSISAKMMEQLVEQVQQQIRNKTVQFNIAQILKNKEQHKYALQICKHVLKPYEPLQLIPAPQQPDNAANQATSSTTELTMVMPAIDPGRFVPNGCANWTWDLSYEMAILELAEESVMQDALQYILQTVEDVGQLVALANNVYAKKEYDQAIIIGTKIFERIEQIRIREQQLQIELINTLLDISHSPENANNPVLIQQLQAVAQNTFITKNQQDNQLSQVYVNQVYPSVVLTYNANWDNYKNNTLLQMINSALESRDEKAPIYTPTVSVRGRIVQPRKVKPVELSKLEQILEFGYNHVSNIDHKINCTRHLVNKQEIRLALGAIEKCHLHLMELKTGKIRRDLEMDELRVIRIEIAESLASKKPIKPESKKRLRDLEYIERMNNLKSPNHNYSLSQYDDSHVTMAQLAIAAIITNKYHAEEAKRLPKEMVEQTILRQIEILERPTDLIRIASDLRTRKEFVLMLCATEKGTRIVNEFQKAREARERAKIPLEMNMEEQNIFTANKQPIPQYLQTEAQKLQEELLKLPKTAYYDQNSADAYDVLHSQIAFQAITGAFESKQPIPVVPLGPQVTWIPFTDEKNRQIVEECLQNVQPFQNMTDISNTCYRYQEIELHIYVAQQTQERIVYLGEQVKTREKPRLEFLALQEEKRSTEEQKKFLKPEQLKQLKEMDLEQRLLRSILPTYYFRSLTQLDSAMQTITTNVIVNMLNRKRTLQTQLQTILDMEAMGQERMQDENDENSKEKIQERIFDTNKKLRDAVDRALLFVQNPSNLIHIATTLRDHSEHELVTLIGKRVQHRILEIAEESKQRQKLLDELEELEEEEATLQQQAKIAVAKKKKLDAEKEKRMEQLKMEKKYFSIFPTYVNMSEERLEDIHLENAKVLLSNVIKARDTTERDEKLSEQEKSTKMQAHDKEIGEIVEMCLKYVQNPTHIIVLMDQMNKSNDIELVLKLGTRVLERLQTCFQLRNEFDGYEQTCVIFEKEQEQLQLLRKTLEKTHQDRYDTAKEKKNNMDIPEYLLSTSQDDLHALKYKALSKMFSSVVQNKLAFESRIATDQSLTQAQVEAEIGKNAELISRVVSICLQDVIGIDNPQNLNAIMSDLFNKREYNHVIRIGQQALLLLKKLREQYQARQLPEQYYILLDKENETLLTQRKQLPTDRQEQLRDLKLKHLINSLRPKFDHNGPEENDKLALLVSRNMIFSALQLKKDLENKMEMDSQHDENDVTKASKEAFDRVKSVVDQCLANILIIENIIKLVQEMSEKLEYDLTLQIGKVCQQYVHDAREKYKEIKELEDEKQQLLTKIKLPTRTIDQQVRLQEVEIKLSQLPIKYQNENTTDAFLLHVGKLMMNAAKVVNDIDVLCQQAEVVFKINMTPETFGEVKVLTPEDKWDSVRSGLLKHVMDQIRKKQEEMKEGKLDDGAEVQVDLDVTGDDDDDMAVDDGDSEEEGYGRRKKKAPAKRAKKSKKRSSASFTVKKSSMKEMIDLLLGEGCWKQVLQVFPDPQYGTMALLERLWIEVDQQDQGKLDELLPLVESYVTKECLTYDYNNASSILEMVSAYDLDWEIKLYGNISEKLLVTIVQKQYSSFVDFLKFIKKRLAEKKKEKKWESFIEALKKKHKQKKKLMTLIEQADL